MRWCSTGGRLYLNLNGRVLEAPRALLCKTVGVSRLDLARVMALVRGGTNDKNYTNKSGVQNILLRHKQTLRSTEDTEVSAWSNEPRQM